MIEVSEVVSLERSFFAVLDAEGDGGVAAGAEIESRSGWDG
jgi:hypothetical protein